MEKFWGAVCCLLGILFGLMSSYGFVFNVMGPDSHATVTGLICIVSPCACSVLSFYAAVKIWQGDK